MTLSEDPGVTLLFNVPGNEPAKHMPREMGRKPGESGDSEAKKREPTNEQLTLSKAAEKLKKNVLILHGLYWEVMLKMLKCQQIKIQRHLNVYKNKNESQLKLLNM